MRKILFCVTITIIYSCIVTPLFANKTSVSIDCPAGAKPGEEVIVSIVVSHLGNNSMHHTDWVWLKVNGIEVKKWEYSGNSLPPSEDFTVTFKIKITSDTEVTAQGDCNMHGSAGIDKKTITVK